MQENFNANTPVKAGDLNKTPDKKIATPSRKQDSLSKIGGTAIKQHPSMSGANINHPTKSGSEHVQSSFWKMADEKNY